MANIDDNIRADLERITKGFNSHEFDSFFKYFSDDEKVINGIFKNQKIRFTQPKALNDPLEFNPTILFKDTSLNYQFYEFNGITLPSIELFFRVQLIESQINKYGVLSLTKTPDSFDMWSRYSNGHRGFLLEFKEDFTQKSCMKSKSGNTYPVKKIEYIEDYSIGLEELVNKDNEITTQILRDNLFYKKTAIWRNENEYRMVRPLTDCPDYEPPKIKYAYSDLNVYLFKFDLECVNSVVLGAMMSRENKMNISQCCQDNKISLYQAHIVRNFKDRFGSMVHINSLDDVKTRDISNDAHPSVFCTDTYKLSSKPKKKINNLNELPYYKDYEDVVNELYQNLKLERNQR